MSGGGWRAANTGTGRPGSSGASLRTRRGIWLGVTLLVAVVVAILLWPLLFGQVAPVRLVAIGMTSNHPAFPARQAAQTTAAVFAELHEKDPKQFPSPPDVREAELHGDRLVSGLRDRLAGESDQTLVVYLNCLGGLLAEGDTATAQLITVNAEPDCLAQGRSDQLVPVARLLETLASIEAARVLVLFDGYTTASNWRVGILNRDFPAVLEAEAESACKKFPNLHVVCASRPGEISGVMDESTPARFALGHFVVEGLKGKADGWVRDPITEQASRDGSTNERVSISELVAFLSDSVDDWSSTHHGVKQTVRYFGSAFEKDSEIVQIRSPVLAEAAEALSEESGEAEGDAKADGKDAESSGEEAGDEAAGDAKPAEEDSKAEGGDEAGSEEKDGKDEDGKSGSKSEEQKQKEALAALNGRLEKLSGQLEAAWTKRDELRQTSLPAANRPREWRRLNYLLVRAERQHRLGEAGALETELKRIAELQRIVAEQVTPHPGEEFSGTLGLTSLAALKRRAATGPKSETESDEAEAEAARREAFETHWKAFSKGTIEDEAVAAFQQIHADSATVRRLFCERVMQHALDADLAEPGAFAAVLNLLAVRVPVETADGVEPSPAELELLHRVCLAGASVPAESLAKFAELCRDTLQMRQELESFALAALPSYELLSPAMADAERKLVATERWLGLGASGIGEARGWFEQARERLTEVQNLQTVVAQAAQLRAELLAELPAYARWCAQVAVIQREDSSRLKGLAGYFADFSWDATEPFPRDTTELLPPGHQTRLLRLMDLTRRLCVVLDSRPADVAALSTLVSKPARAGNSPDNSLSSLVSELTGLWGGSGESFRVGFRDEIERLAGEVPSASSRERVLVALEVPWLERPLRKRLLEHLNPTKQISGADLAKDVREASADHGEWDAFWCLHTLCLTGLDTEESRAAWQVYRKLASAGAESRVAESVRTGLHISGLWTTFATGLELYSPLSEVADAAAASGWQLAFCAHPADDILTEAIDPVLSRQSERLTGLASDRARAWMRRAGSFENLPGAGPLAAAWEQAVDVVDRPVVPHLLGEMPGPVRLRPASRGRLDVTAQAGDDRNRRVRLKFQNDFVVVKKDSRQVSREGVEIDSAVRSDARSFEISLAANAPPRPQTLTMILTDSADEFPWDIRQITVTRPPNASNWRIAFVIPGKVSSFVQETPPDDLVSVVEDRNRPVSAAEDRTRLMLPPDSPAAKLKPVLLPPAGTDISVVDVVVWAAGQNGEPAGDPLATIKGVQLSEDGRAVPLELPAAAAAPTAPAAAPATAPAATPGTDVSNGLIFEIQIPGEAEKIRHIVSPTVRDAQDLLDEPEVKFQRGVLTVSVRRSPRWKDPLIPEKLPVVLKLSPELRKLKPVPLLGGDATTGDPVILSATFSDTDAVSERRYPVFLGVSGVPHAFGWLVRNNFAGANALDQELRIEAPEDALTLAAGDPLKLSLGVYLRTLEDPPFDKGWQIECSYRPLGFSAWTKIPARPVSREHDHSVRLKLVEGQWSFATASTDYAVEIPTRGLGSVYEVQVGLAPPPGVFPGLGARFKKRLTFGVDVKDATPDTPKLVEAPGFKGNSKQLSFLMDGRTMKLTVTVSDAESGVHEAVWGFDKGGADGDGVLTDSDPGVNRQEFSVLKSGERTVTIEIPPDDQPKPGEQVLLVSAVDGLEAPSDKPLKIPVQLSVPDKVGLLVLKMKYYRISGRTIGTRVELRQKGREAIEIDRTMYAREVSRTLPVGEYEVVIVRNGRDKVLGKVTVTEGKRKEHPIEF